MVAVMVSRLDSLISSLFSRYCFIRELDGTLQDQVARQVLTPRFRAVCLPFSIQHIETDNKDLIDHFGYSITGNQSVCPSLHQRLLCR